MDDTNVVLLTDPESTQLSLGERFIRLLQTLADCKPDFRVSCTLCHDMTPSDQKKNHLVHFLRHHTTETDDKNEVFFSLGLPDSVTYHEAWEYGRNRIAQQKLALTTNVHCSEVEAELFKDATANENAETSHSSQHEQNIVQSEDAESTNSKIPSSNEHDHAINSNEDNLPLRTEEANPVDENEDKLNLFNYTNSFSNIVDQVPSTSSAPMQLTVKRKRGRPRKNSSVQLIPTARKSRRPRKCNNVSNVTIMAPDGGASAMSVEKRKRGRPRKHHVVSDASNRVESSQNLDATTDAISEINSIYSNFF